MKLVTKKESFNLIQFNKLTIMLLCMFVLFACGGGDDPKPEPPKPKPDPQVQKSKEAQIKTFQFDGQSKVAKIDNNNKTIHYTVAHGTNITALTATATFSAKASISPEPKTARNYTKPQTFTVTAEDGETKSKYTVTVKIAPSTDAQITNFTVNGNEATIKQGNRLITYQFPYKANNPTDLSNLTVTYTLSRGATISPIPTANKDYSAERTFTVRAQNGSTTTDYTVRITNAPSNEAVITKFQFTGTSEEATIDEDNKTITYNFHANKDITALTATVEKSSGATITPDPTQALNYTDGQTFTITSADKSKTVSYKVSVTVSPTLSDKALITKFQFNTTPPITINNIDQNTREITYTFPYKDREKIRSLGATVTISDGAKIVQKGTTINPNEANRKIDYTQPVTFTVTAQDGNTTKEYTVTVSKEAPNTEAKITAFTLGTKQGVINEEKKEIIITHDYKYDATRKVNDNIKLVTDVKAMLTKSKNATITPDPTKSHSYAYNTDNTKNYKRKFTVTAEDGTTQKYTVKILFTVPQTGDKTANIKTLVNAVHTEMKNATNPATANLNHLDTSNVTNMAHLFNASNFQSPLNDEQKGLTKKFNGDISQWDVSKVTEMQYMFIDCYAFNGDISKWDVSSVTNMRVMFNTNRNFNADISSWDVSNVTDMAAMFSSTKLFNRDISNWDVSNVTNMSNMFSGASVFNQNISKWDVSSVTDMRQMFFFTGLFNQNLSEWKTDKVTKCSFFSSNSLLGRPENKNKKPKRGACKF